MIESKIFCTGVAVDLFSYSSVLAARPMEPKFLCGAGAVIRNFGSGFTASRLRWLNRFLGVKTKIFRSMSCILYNFCELFIPCCTYTFYITGTFTVLVLPILILRRKIFQFEYIKLKKICFLHIEPEPHNPRGDHTFFWIVDDW